MSNITITHAPSGLVHAEVLGAERISPHFMRVTLGGEDLQRFEWRGFDQWVRLALPVDDATRFDTMPDRIDMRGYLKYLMLPKTTRPVIRNYTLRDYRPESAELDIDFVVHGTEGIAGPWAAAATPGEHLAFIDQGCGWKDIEADSTLLVADESGLPAVVGVLRDLPRDTIGHAVIEVPDIADAQHVQAPSGVTVHWIVRRPGERPGAQALEHTQELELYGTPYVFAVGESQLATGIRRWAVGERGIPKGSVTFCGYWKLGRAQPS